MLPFGQPQEGWQGVPSLFGARQPQCGFKLRYLLALDIYLLLLLVNLLINQSTLQICEGDESKCTPSAWHTVDASETVATFTKITCFKSNN